MAILLRCESSKCQKPLRVEDDLAGKTIRCPACKNSQTAPAASVSAISFYCSNKRCGRALRMNVDAVGKMARCPSCQHHSRVPPSSRFNPAAPAGAPRLDGRVGEIRQIDGPKAQVQQIHFSPDGGRVLVAAWDWSIKVFDTQTWARLYNLSHESEVQSAMFSPDGSTILSGGGALLFGTGDSAPRLWDAATGQLRFRGEPQPHPIKSVAFSPYGRRGYTGSFKLIKTWDLEDMREIQCIEASDTHIYDVAVSPDGELIAASDQNFTVRIWNAKDGSEHLMLSQIGWANGLAFRPGKRELLVAYGFGKIILWDVETGTKIREYSGHDKSVESIGFSADGERFVSGGADKTVRVWSVEDGELHSFQGHKDKLGAVACSPDGRLALSGCTCGGSSQQDFTLRLWGLG